MTVDLRPSTCRMIEESPATAEVWAFIQWLQAEHYTDYVIDCQALAQVFPDAVAPPPGGRLLIDGSDLTGWLRRL